MKKFTSIIIVLALMLSLSVPVFAVGPGDKVEVTFTYELVEPKFMVEIPATIELELDEVVYHPISIGISNPEVLNGRKIVITLDDALVGDVSWFGELRETYANYNDFFIVTNNDATGAYYKTLFYYFIAGSSGGSRLAQLKGGDLLAFTEDGSKNIGFWLTTTEDSYTTGSELNHALIYPNSRYTGWVVFGVKIIP